jgi:Na+-translocating ferredoxin:NAD+ oxidoreductase RnfC subunit
MAGEVIEIVELERYHEETGDRLENKVDGVKIRVSSDQKLEGSGVTWEKEKPKNLRELFYLAGLTSFGQTGIPTEFNSSIFAPDQVEHVLVNAVRTEPFVHHVIAYAEEFSTYKTGLEILARAFPKAQIHLVMDLGSLEGLGTVSSSQRIKVHSAEEESYMNRTKMLARKFLGKKELDDGGYLMDHGVLGLPEIFPLEAYRCVVEGKPLVSKRFSLGGPGAEDRIVEAPIGTPLKVAVRKDVDPDVDALTILGGPLAGHRLKTQDMPVGKELDSLVRLTKPQGSELLAWLQPGLTKNSYTNAFFSALTPDKKREANSGLHGERRPCVYCGWCSDICPVDILPFQISKTYNHDKVDEVNRLQPQRCIDCGLCSYVCPSKIPLSETVKKAKQEQPGENHNYVKYEEDEEGLISVVTEGDEKGRGEESE